MIKRIMLFALVLSGCASTEVYKQRLETWMGRDINDYIMETGPPSSTYTMPNGDVAYTWDRTGREGTSAMVLPAGYGAFAVANKHRDWCQTTFFTGKVGTIKSYRFEGNSCAEREPTPYDNPGDVSTVQSGRWKRQ